MHYSNQLFIATILMNVFATTTAALLRGGGGRRRIALSEHDIIQRLVHHDFSASSATTTDKLIRVSSRSVVAVLHNSEQQQQQQASNNTCEYLEYAAVREEVILPQVFVSEPSGEQMFYYFLYDPADITSSKSSEEDPPPEPVAFYLGKPEQHVTFNNTCYQGGSYFMGVSGSGGTIGGNGDGIMTLTPCDGSPFSDTSDYMIYNGVGRFQCAAGSVVKNDDDATSDYIIFELSFCIDEVHCYD